MPDQPIEETLPAQVSAMLAEEAKVKQMEDELAQNEQFQNFINFQKEVQAKSAAFWKEVEVAMINNDIKSLKGEWGSLTIVERTNYAADLNELPSKFIKKVADTTKISQSFKLENKLPKGVTTSITKYLMKRFK